MARTESELLSHIKSRKLRYILGISWDYHTTTLTAAWWQVL